MTDNQDHVYTDETDPRIAGLFRDLFDPAVTLFKRARANVPKERRADVEGLLALGQAFVCIPFPTGKASCAVDVEGKVLELGKANIEKIYWQRLDVFREFGFEHMKHAEKWRAAYREERIGLVAIVVVNERRIRLVALLENDPARPLSLFELTGGAETPGSVVH